MRQQYRRQSFSAWVFWGALIIGGTLYGAYRFDWFPVGYPFPASAPQEMATAKKTPVPDKAPAQSPPDGQIEVAQSPAGPQSEPPPSEFDEPPVAKSEIANSTKARLLEQRAEGPTPKLRSNVATGSNLAPPKLADATAVQARLAPAATVKATVAEVTPSTRPEPAAVSPSVAKSKPAAGPIVQRVNATDEKETAPIDPELEADLEKIDHFLQNSDLLRAHRELSMVYWAKPRWRSAIKERIEKTANAIYFDSEPQFLQPYVVKTNDQFAVFAKRYNVPWEYLAKLNHVDPKKIQPGQQLKVIKGPFSAIVELNGFLLTLHAYGYYVRSYPIGIGKDGATPLGKFTVLKKVKDPQYTDPQGQVIEGGDPNNPLGVRWLDLGKSYGIHGTIAPNSIGKAESRGCIRLRNEDVEEVYDMLAVGSEVTIRR
jgi:lipoprotein-anchoring transpeptidase ErfK/SrfK